MHSTLFHSPTAGSKLFQKEDILAALRLAKIDARYVSIEGDEVSEAFRKKTDLFIAAGGDGTIGTVVCGARNIGVPVAILPLGTANNVARSLNIAGTPEELVETWNLSQTTWFDIGRVQGAEGTRFFVESFGIGLIPAYLNKASGNGKSEGAAKLQRGRALLQKLLRSAHPVHVEINIEDKRLSGEFFGVEILNVAFTGPGLPLGHDADPTDGKLDVVCFDASKRNDLIKWLDAPLDGPAPVRSWRARQVTLQWHNTPSRIDDASFEGSDNECSADVACDHGAVRIVVPQKLTIQTACPQADGPKTPRKPQ